MYLDIVIQELKSLRKLQNEEKTTIFCDKIGKA